MDTELTYTDILSQALKRYEKVLAHYDDLEGSSRQHELGLKLAAFEMQNAIVIANMK